MKYMVTGGVASVIYGDPRLTRDIDIVLSLTGSDVDRFSSLFSEDDFYVPPLETVKLEAGRERYGHFNVIHRDTALRADSYLSRNRARGLAITVLPPPAPPRTPRSR